MYRSWDDMICPNCGTMRHEDARVAIMAEMKPSVGVAVYAGEYENMRDVSVNLRLIESTRSQSYFIPKACPFCGAKMLRCKDSADDRRAGLKRYECENNHRITLLEAEAKVTWR